MAYIRNNMISRAGYSGVSGTLSDIGGALKDVGAGAINLYGSQQQAVGAAAASAQTNRDLAAALQANSGPDMTTILLLGGAGLVAFLMLRKKSA